MVEKNNGTPFQDQLMGRRTFLRRSGAIATGVALAGVLGTPSRIGDEPELSPIILPAGGLFLLGGGIAIEKKIIAIAAEHGITKEQLASPDTLSKAEWATLTKACEAEKALSIYTDVAKAGSIKGKTVVCVSSASDDAAINAEYYKLVFRLLGAAKVVTIADKNDANDPAKVRVVGDRRNTPLIYFGGGKQDKLVERFAGTKAFEKLYERYMADPSLLIGGSSAGAMMVSEHMIDDHKVIIGMKLLTRVIVDTHIHRTESRIPRLQEACRKYPECLGIGMDEVTGVLIKKGTATVMGEGGVWKIEPKDTDTKEEDLPVYKAGDSFKLGRHALIPRHMPPEKPAPARGPG